MKRTRFSLLSAALLLVLPFSAVNAFGQAQAVLTRHVRNAGAQPIGQLPSGQIMNLDVVLPVRDQAGLETFLNQIYDRASPLYRHFLTVAEFTERFGPSQEDYDALVHFVSTNGFRVVGGTRDSMEVQIRGPVSAVETAFHITMRTYLHPTESRSYYAPDHEPTANLPFLLWHISGLDNYSIPHPVLSKKSDYAKAHGITPEALVPLATTGSGPSASFLGSDMRAAYYGGTGLTGAGQNLGLLEYGGTDLADLATYFKNVGQTNNVPITLLSTDGTSTACTAATGCDDLEQTIDMTQAIGMATGLSSLVMYIGSLDTAILGAMTTHSPLPQTIGCSWTWSPGDPTANDQYFEKMAAQGQTFFAASGDNSTSLYPAYDPYVVSVGGTDLTTAKADGAWASETAWVSSGGGISPYPIPWWQTFGGVINSSNRGSTVFRNNPDVSANANWSFYVCANQAACTSNDWGGTSFAAPMWAGYIALVNQQLDAKAFVGFINPTIYAQNVTPSYFVDFHDIASGTSGSYSAVPGYDLVTGWGSPNAGLINALAPPPIVPIPRECKNCRSRILCCICNGGIGNGGECL
jgi:subtilase family serine protease